MGILKLKGELDKKWEESDPDQAPTGSPSRSLREKDSFLAPAVLLQSADRMKVWSSTPAGTDQSGEKHADEDKAAPHPGRFDRSGSKTRIKSIRLL